MRARAARASAVRIVQPHHPHRAVRRGGVGCSAVEGGGGRRGWTDGEVEEESVVQAEADPADIPDWAMGFTPLAERLYADSLFLTKVHDPSSSPEAP